MSNDTGSDLSYADTLWKSAEALRGQVDAAEYIGDAVDEGEVINLFAAAGLDAARLDISYDGLPVRRW